jgi:HD-like signal output (HDOD) protein
MNQPLTMNPPLQDDYARKVSERYRRVIENIENLPALPVIVSRLLEVVNSPETSADDASKLIQKDPALTSKVIRLANSAFYGMPRSVSSVSSAIVILGFNVIRSVVLSASIMKMFSDPSKQTVNRDHFWKHSVITAIAAKELVRHLLSFKLYDPEGAFCAGILHDIGKLIFNEYIPADYMEVCRYSQEHAMPLLDAETLMLGINHAEIGRILADKWALPLDLELSMVFHHYPDRSEEIVDFVNIIHLADHIAHDADAGLFEGEAVTPEWTESRTGLRVDDDVYTRIREHCVAAAAGPVEYLSIVQ